MCVSASDSNVDLGPEAIPGIPVGLESAKGGKRGKAGVKNALSLAQLSTASMGR